MSSASAKSLEIAYNGYFPPELSVTLRLLLRDVSMKSLHAHFLMSCRWITIRKTKDGTGARNHRGQE